jgi:predicted transcriptional regulator
MRTEFLEEIGDTIFAIGIAAGIGIGASNLAIEVTKERAVLDAASRGHENVLTTTTGRAPQLHRNSPEQPRTDGMIGF